MPVAVRRAIGFSAYTPTLHPFLLGWNTSSQGLGATGSTQARLVFERTNMPRPDADGTASVPAGTERGSGSWFSFWTDRRPAVYWRSLVIVACDKRWFGRRSTVCNSRWTRPWLVGGSPGYTSIFKGVVLNNRGSFVIVS